MSNRIVIFDTTLRDGEQSPGASMSTEEKLRIALMLEAMGVDVIEAGFPVSSQDDFVAVQRIAREIKTATVCGLARATHADIERAAEAIKPAAHGRIHTFISTSPLHMQYKLRLTADQVFEQVVQSVSYARTLTDDVEWSAEDASRTEHDFLCRCVEAAIKAGARTVNIPDTVGYAVPDEFASLIAMLYNRVPNIDKAIISVHCHNDLGLAVANSLAAVKTGVRQVECTINGLGERAGNASLEEIVMALRTRHDVMPYHTGIKTEYLTRASRLVASVTGMPVQPNKAIVGANAFAHEAGIHQHGVLAHAATYEIMTPGSVGLTKSDLVLGKHSGRHAFHDKLCELGYVLNDAELDEVVCRFKELADQKKGMVEEDLILIADDVLATGEDKIVLVAFEYAAGTNKAPCATLTLSNDDIVRTATATGDGPVAAAVRCITEIVGNDIVMESYRQRSVGEGADAQAVCELKLTKNGVSKWGRGTGTDIVIASVRAYLNALNKLA